MVGVCLLCHGAFGEGLSAAVRMIAGDLGQLRAVALSPEDTPEAYRDRLLGVVAELDEGDGVLLCADLYHGTPCNVATALALQRPNLAVVAGVNLGAVLEAVLNPGDALAALAERVAATAKQSVHLVAYGGELVTDTAD